MTPLLTPPEAQDMGFHVIVYPLSGLYSATKYVPDAFTCSGINAVLIVMLV